MGNTTLWILIILLILGSRDGNIFNGMFTGCGLPILLALLYCLHKNGTISDLFPTNGGCGCQG